MKVEPKNDARVRRMAKKAGYKAVKSRRRNSPGGYMLVDPSRNAAVYGTYYELSPDDVIEICSP